MKENHTGGRAESFSCQILLHKVIVILQSLDWGLNIAQSQGKLQKCLNYQKYIRGSLEKSTKRWSNGGQSLDRAGCKNSQPCKISAVVQFPSVCGSNFLPTFDTHLRVWLGFFVFESARRRRRIWLV